VCCTWFRARARRTCASNNSSPSCSARSHAQPASPRCPASTSGPRTTVDSLNDYRTDDGVNTRSAGGRALIQHVIGDPTIATTFEWKEFEHANARWLFHREVARLFQGALGLARTDSPKFDALVGFGSRAHKQIVTTAHQVVETYVDNVDLKQRRPDPYTVGSVLVRKEEMESFNNALHDGYSGLNSLELTFARSLDRTGLAWFRNPSRCP
jgi:type III restriction enzyme